MPSDADKETMFDQQVTFIYSRDIDNSAEFYAETLGLDLVLDQGACRIFQTSPNGFLGVCRCGEQRPVNPEGIIITLVTADVDGWHQRLEARGVDFDTAPTANHEYNIYHCFLTDPDGYQIEIQSFLDPTWPEPT